MEEQTKEMKPLGENEEKDSESTLKAVFSGIGIALGSLLGVILLVLVVLVIAGFQFYFVLTDSMSPTINRNQTVLVNTNADKYNLQVGDIVTFNKGNLTVTHRIMEVKVGEDGSISYVQGSDLAYRQMLGEKFENINDLEPDGIITPEQVKGKVATINGNPVKLVVIGAFINIFHVGNMLDVLKIVLIVAIIALVIWSIISHFREKNKKIE